MILAIICLVLGIVIGAASIWAIGAAGFTVLGILAGLGLAVGGALIVAAWALTADRISPTSRKL